MIPKSTVQQIAEARLEDAKALFTAGRFDGSTYLCGYAVELALKRRICDTLQWADFPVTTSEFKGLTSFKVHDLDLLLRLTGMEAFIKANHFPEWSIVNQWNPEVRYKPIGATTKSDAELMLEATETLLSKL